MSYKDFFNCKWVANELQFNCSQLQIGSIVAIEIFSVASGFLISGTQLVPF